MPGFRKSAKLKTVQAGKTNWSGRFSTVDLLVLTSLDQLFFEILNVIYFLPKGATLVRRSTVLSLPVQLAFLGYYYLLKGLYS